MSADNATYDQLDAAAYLIAALPPVPARFDVGRVAFAELQADRWPEEITRLVERTTGFPALLAPAVHIDDTLPLAAWRALDRDGNVIGEGRVELTVRPG